MGVLLFWSVRFISGEDGEGWDDVMCEEVESGGEVIWEEGEGWR